MRSTSKITFLLLVLLCTQACSTTHVALQYRQAQGAARLAPLVPLRVGTFEDARETPGTYLGSVKSGWGTPMKKLVLAAPASEVVAKVFSEALQARQSLSSSSASSVSGRILKFDCSQYVRREAHAEIEILVSRAGKQIFKKTYRQDEVSGSAFALDTAVFASVEDLRVVAEQALANLADKVFNDAEFLRALK